MTGESEKGSTFRVGLIQTRSGRSPAANLDAVVKLIGEAKTGGANYVQTPEMTNIMEASRDKLLAAITPEENDASLATFRELARKFLLSEEGRQEVVASDVYARRLGINGVPCFIVNRKYAVSGAQPPSAFVEVFNLAERDAATSTAQSTA